jgi:hypothetical protein
MYFILIKVYTFSGNLDFQFWKQEIQRDISN